MAAFKNEPEEWQRPDWMILRNGWVSLYSKPEFLLIDMSWFRNQRYRVMEFDCATWKDDEALHADLKRRFRFPDAYGNNLNALKDSLAEVSVPGAGLVVVLHHFDAVEKKTAQAILEVFAENARFHLLLAERIITLVQVDDAQVKYDAVGATPVFWNRYELLPLPGEKA
ncbi:barstar family protein [Pontibacter sp. 172403-2]|uniref:barstar family protein n=1 Tax=Pontibacter rufus TaxID=2791028 RepID=UPI0018AF8721|nr:barstar family protein [Pontibacter sp. 172403-2]MBF9252077.1 barstar family protein [Pontibacter sp. 172403-2]